MSRAPTTFSVTCPQCKTAVPANDTQIDKLITCPDCLEEFVVARPAVPSQPKSQTTARPRGAETRPASTPSQDANRADSDSSANLKIDDDLFSSGNDDDAPRSESGDHAIWDEDRQQLNALLNVEPSQSGSPPASDEPYDFTMACPLCGTRQEVKSEQIGHSVRCPDCHSKYKVREPSRKSRRPRQGASSADDGEIQLSELDPQVPVKSDFRSMPDRAVPIAQLSPSHGPEKRPTIMTPQDASRDTLARAQKDLDEQLKGQRQLPGSPMTSGVFRFLQHPTVVLRIFFITLAWWLELEAIQAAVGLTHAGPLQQFASVILRPFALVFGLLLAANFAAWLLTVAQDTSNGRDQMESLPGVNPVEWFFESWQIFVSLFLVLILPGVAVPAIYSATGSASDAFFFGLVPAGILLATVFPVILLSFLDNSTPFSASVLRGLQLAVKSWMMFTAQALGLAGLGIGLLAVRWSSSSWIVNFGLCAGLVVLALLFFRLLGRLTWVCQEKLALDTAAP